MQEPAGHDDLVVERLLASCRKHIEPVTSLDEAVALVQAGEGSGARNSILWFLRTADSVLRESLADWADVTDGGLSLLTDLHARPMREIQLSESSVLMATYEIDGERLIVLAPWQITERRENKSATAATLLDIEQLRAAVHRDDIERRLCRFAVETGFCPKRPRMRAAAVVTLSVRARLADLERQLKAAAAIHDTELFVFVATHDPRDGKAAAKFTDAVMSNRHAMLLTASEPTENWVFSLGRRFRKSGRATGVLTTSGVEEATETCSRLIKPVALSMPARPVVRWGEEAGRVLDGHVCESFVLTDGARSHARSNPYPDVERMLLYLSRLAEFAAEWARRSRASTFNGQFETLAAAFELEVALHDGSLGRFEFLHEGRTFVGVPHVKVDDHKKPNATGRIYFAIDARPNDGIFRLVVHYIGLHPKSGAAL